MAMAVSEVDTPTLAEPLVSLPIIGSTLVEDAVFYTVIGVVAAAGWVSWPTAALVGSGHALHQRARNVAREGAVGEAREALIEAADELL